MTRLSSWRRSALLALLAGFACCHDPCPDTAGLRQSPIDLDMCADTRQTAQKPLRFTNFHAVPYSINVTNTGSMVQGEITWAVGRYQVPQVSGGHLPGRFVPLGLDLHWGANLTSGSEHSVNGRRYPVELHIRCRNVLYSSNAEAVKHVDGLAGIIVFFENDGVRLFKKRGLGLLAPALVHIKNASTSVEIGTPPSMRQLMPSNVNRFVTYAGSVTSLPPCPEVVTWTALLTPLPVLSLELQQMQQLLDAHGHPLESSAFRPQRSLNGRPLYTRGVFPICV